MWKNAIWKNLKKQLWQWRGVFIVVPATTGVLLGLRFAGLLQPLELAAYDLFFQWRSPEPTDDRIVIVAIDELDVQKYNSPISDVTLAKLLNLVKQQQPRAIGLDIYRDLPIEPGHQELIAVFESTPNLLGIRKVIGNQTARVAPSPILDKLNRIAANDFIPDGDSKIRRIFVSVQDKQQNKNITSLSASLALKYLAAEKINVEVLDSKTKKYKLGKAIIVPFESNDGGYVRAQSGGGYQILSNYRNFNDNFRTVSLTDVLESRISQDIFRDRIVLIGVTAESGGDYFATPHNSPIFGSPIERTAGVVLHANISSQIIASALDGRPLIQVWSKPIECLWISIWVLVGGLLCWTRRYADSQNQANQIFRLPLAALAIALLGGGLVAGSYLMFGLGWWIPVVPSLLALFGSAIAVTAYTAQSASGMRQIFGRYLTDEVVTNLLETPEGLNLGGEKRKVTLLFSDLRGFSALFERVTPEQGVEAISLYLDVMTSVVSKYKGTINEFVGDGIFVMFGAPIQREDDTQRAVTCAIAMQLAMTEVNAALETKQLPALQMGIGVHTGEVLAGNIGSHRRAKYTVMGTTVNLASRIESYTVGGQVLVSEAILNEVKAIVRIDSQISVKPKGFTEAIALFDIRGINDLSLPEEDQAFVTLVKPVAMKWNVLEGKHISDKRCLGSLLKLSANNAEIRTDRVMKTLTNLQITLFDSEKTRKMENVYAKVVEVSLEDSSYCWIRFTDIPPDIAEWLYDLRQTAMVTTASIVETDLSD
jgi:adenylate cyclase